MRRTNFYLFIVALALFGLWFVAAKAGTTWASGDNDSTGLFYKATVRFEDKLSSNQLKAFHTSTGVFQTQRKMLDKVEASELVYKYAVTSDTRSSVEISTSNGNGARVRYQTLGQRMRKEAPTTAKQPTAVTERMYIGRYYIWSERSDKPTSDPNSEFEIVSPVEKVMLQEK